jgi:3-hydroxymyristoyl/3-hydroxydecanoyl-(acyl carrier protein) dehydratase
MMDGGREITRLVEVARKSTQTDETESHELTLRVPPELRWLRGHFEGNPVLPAVVQILEVVARISELWPELDHPRRLFKAKFRRAIQPPDLLRLRLHRRLPDSTVRFEYIRGEETCSSGILDFSRQDGRTE